MEDPNFVLLREFLTQRLNTLEARLDQDRAERKEQVADLMNEIKQQHSTVNMLREKCEGERGRLWCKVHDLEAHDREEGARQNGLRRALEGRARFWMVMGAVAGSVYALMYGVSLYVKYAFGAG